MEEEQRVAQKEKAERIARRAADKAKRAADKKAKDAALAEGNTSSEVDVEGAQVASSNGPNDDSGEALKITCVCRRIRSITRTFCINH